MRVISYTKWGAITCIKQARSVYTLQVNEEFSDIGELGEAKDADGNFITHVKTQPELDEEKILDSVYNKQEAYKEYLELEKMYPGSVQALAARDAYLRISEESPDKCRYELEMDLAQAEETAEIYMTIYLDSEGAW